VVGAMTLKVEFNINNSTNIEQELGGGIQNSTTFV
jgi:hypothetical protein